MIVSGLHPIKGVSAIRMIYPVLFYSRIHVLMFCVDRLQFHLQFTHRLSGGLNLDIQGLALQRQQLRFKGALFCFELSVFLCRHCLTLQILQLPLQLITNICEALKVFMRAPHSALCLFAPLFVLRDAGRFFDKNPQFLRLGLYQATDHPLFNDRVTSRPQPRP